MNTEWITPLEWDNEGIEPSAKLKAEGFKPQFKPAADTFNYFLNKERRCIERLQEEHDKLTPVHIVRAYSMEFIIDDSPYLLYRATNPHVELVTGTTISFIPNETSTYKRIFIQINDSPYEVPIYQSLSSVNSALVSPTADNWLSEGRPILLIYCETTNTAGTVTRAWKTVATRTTNEDVYGTIELNQGGTGVNYRELAAGAFYLAPDSTDSDNDEDTAELKGKYGVLPVEYGGTGRNELNHIYNYFITLSREVGINVPLKVTFNIVSKESLATSATTFSQFKTFLLNAMPSVCSIPAYGYIGGDGAVCGIHRNGGALYIEYIGSDDLGEFREIEYVDMPMDISVTVSRITLF